MIIQEMEAEVAAHESCADDLARIDELEDKREKLEDELRYYQARFKDLTRQIDAHSAKGENGVTLTHLSAERGRAKRGVERIRALLREVDKESILLERSHRQTLPPLLGLAPQGGDREIELRRPGRGIRVPLHVARLELPRLLAAAVLP